MFKINAEFIVLSCIAVLLIFVIWRFHHYIKERPSGHDRYLVGKGECPDLDMWGFKWSVLLILTIFNAIILAYVCIRLPKNIK